MRGQERQTAEGSAGFATGRARIVLGVIVATLLVAAFVGPAGAQSPTPSPSESPTDGPSPTAPPSPTGPSIKFFNPSPGYDPKQTLPPRPPGTPDPPHVSDRLDGRDNRYHILATGTQVPANVIVEAAIAPLVAGVPIAEQTIGVLDPVPNKPNAWEMFWDVPDTLPEGRALMAVRMFREVAPGVFEELAADEVQVDVGHQTTTGSEAHETPTFTYPTQTGPLGFYKGRGGAWRTIVEGLASAGNTQDRVRVMFTTTPFGESPTFTSCTGNIGFGGARPDTSRPFVAVCTLPGKTTPSELTALAVVYLEDQNPQGNIFQAEQDSADVHLVQPYQQIPSLMNVTLEPSDDGGLFIVDTGRQVAGDQCLAFVARVTDHLGRFVLGANLDAEAVGPTDQLQFGDQIGGPDDEEFIFFFESSSHYKNPDKGEHRIEVGHDCDERNPDDFTQDPNATQGEQGEHNVPGTTDVKHRESVAGSGLDVGFSASSAPRGAWEFHIFSNDVGFTDLTVWVDDEDLPAESENRPVDTDTREDDEPFATFKAQWMPAPITVSVDPASSVAEVGRCHAYMVKVRAGTAPVPGVNVDLHATGPSSDLDFCDPLDASARRAPDRDTSHVAEDAGESGHSGAAPQTQHAEGETDANGNFIVGLMSPIAGDTTLEAWFDGDKVWWDFSTRTSDDDVQGSAESGTSEAGGSATTSWVELGEARVSFLNPSGYGPSSPEDLTGTEGDGSQVADRVDADSTFHVVAKVTSLVTLPGLLDILVAPGHDATGGFAKVGDALRVETGDTYGFAWDVPAQDGDFTLRAQIPGTNTVVDRNVVVNNADSVDPDPQEAPFTTLEVTSPANGAALGFVNRAAPISGTASAGTDGVDLFYTKVGSTTPEADDWIFCGFVGLTGASFSGSCKLADADQAAQVAGIAAITYDCAATPCNANPSQSPARSEGFKESGDAHRVFGLEANPIVSLDPAEAQTVVGTCEKFVLTITDPSAQPIPGQNVDVHLTGPGETPDFCDPPDSSPSPRRAPDQGGHATGDNQGAHTDDTAPDIQHAEGELSANGKFVFGISSQEVGDSQLLTWIDWNGNDIQDPEERTDTSTMHWVEEAGTRCTIEGTSAGERITGTEGDDIICAKGGNDKVRGLGGNDVIKGQGGNDRLIGGPGNDILKGGRGKDTLRGGRGKDRLNGGADRDTCRGGPQKDKRRSCENLARRRVVSRGREQPA